MFFKAFAPTIIFWIIIIFFGKRILLATISFLKKTKGYILVIGFGAGIVYGISTPMCYGNSLICIFIWVLSFIIFVIVKIKDYKRKKKEKQLIKETEEVFKRNASLRKEYSDLQQELAMLKTPPKPTYEELEREISILKAQQITPNVNK